MLITVCIEGYGRPDDEGPCGQCDVGFYSNGERNETCVSCNVTETTENMGSTDVQQCGKCYNLMERETTRLSAVT